MNFATGAFKNCNFGSRSDISFFFGSGEGNIVPSCLNYGEDPNVCIKGECELGCKILCPIEEKFLSH